MQPMLVVGGKTSRMLGMLAKSDFRREACWGDCANDGV
jgi:hypothetical protein